MSEVITGNLSTESQNTTEPSEEITDRRAFLTKAGLVTSVFAMIGMAASDSAEAQGTLNKEQATALSNLVSEATEAKSSERKAVFTKFEKQVPAKVLAPFKSLTEADWKQVADLQVKLKGIKGVVSDNNVGVVGM